MAGYSVTFTVVDNATKQIDAINRRVAAMRAPMERMSKTISRFVDVTGLNKIAQGFKWIGDAAGGVLRTLVEIVPVLGTITGAATIAGMAKLVSSYANWSQALVSTADNLGMTTQQLQKFEDATRLAGGNASDMDAALKSLYSTAAAFVRSGGTANADATQWFNRLGINVKDATGHLRNMNDLMPEVLQKIAAIQNPADRAAASAALLGDANANLVETFRRSHQSFSQWLTDASRYTDLTEQQKSQLQAFAEAQGRVSTAFDHLGQQIAATLATNLTPFMNKLAEFVEKHTPQIIAAVDKLSKEFSDWLASIDWDKVQAGLDKFMDGITWVVNNLDTVKTAAEAVVAVFVAGWGVKMLGVIAQITTALGAVGGGAAAAAGGGSGLLGALGQVAAIGAAIAAAGAAKGLLEKGSESVERGIFGDERVEEHKRLQEQGAKQFWSWLPTWMGGTRGAEKESATAGPAAPGATGSVSEALGITKAQYSAFAGSISGIESKGQYNIMGGSSGRFAGRYQMGADEIRETAAQLREPTPTQQQFLSDPSMQERYFERYTLSHHQWLMAHNAKYRTMSPEDKAAALAYAHNQGAGGASQWIDTGMVGKDAFGTAGTRYSAAVHRAFSETGSRVERAPPDATPTPAATAPPATVPPTQPTNGKVDIDITHKNAPPDAAVTARGTGAVNVAPPRVEHQSLETV